MGLGVTRSWMWCGDRCALELTAMRSFSDRGLVLVFSRYRSSSEIAKWIPTLVMPRSYQPYAKIVLIKL